MEGKAQHPDHDVVVANRDRYLRLLKDALLDRHYLENEVRLDYLAGLAPGQGPDGEALRDPARTLEVRYRRLSQSRIAGRSTDDPRGGSYTPYADMGQAALDHLEASLVDLVKREVPGDLLECGVGRGGAGILLRACLDAYDIEDRSLWMADPFRASNPPVQDDEHLSRKRLRADLHQVRDGFERFELLDDRVRFLSGAYDVTLGEAPPGPLALVRIGIDAAYTLNRVLRLLAPRLSPGATIIVEGLGRPVIEKRFAALGEGVRPTTHLHRVDWNTVSWQVGAAASAVADGIERDVRAGPRHGVAVIPPVESDRVDLTVVVVFYDMAREAARTLRSLSRSYQQGIDDVSYEVIVVDNGSHPDQRLGVEDVAAYGPEFRLITLEDAPPSPTVALNRGIKEARGDAVAVMIDGAHVLTPGVFRHALAAMGTYEPAVVAIQQWYVGPGQQGDAQQAGYDQAVEDKLFQGIRWPTDGYRLFEIGHFIGDRDWFDGIIESNCLFAPRALLEQVGGFDDSFDMPGGGYANLELFERLHHHPGVNPASVLGEGTFHQFHGGTTTNVADEAVRRERISSYGAHFRETKGRGLLGLNKAVHYVGSMDTKAARRTRSRREFLLSFDHDRDPVGTTDPTPLPVPEELKFAAIEALWEQAAWRDATWLGHPVARYPTDLHTYQELVTKVRPEVVVLVGDDPALAGRARFFASITAGLSLGPVIAVGRAAGSLDDEPRVVSIGGRPEEPDVVEQLIAAVAGRDAMVFIGLGAHHRVMAAFEAYAPLVPVGGYVVVENTVVNGRPAAPSFGPGPHEAVSALLQLHRDFVPDVTYERYTVTFNKNGYLRRMPTSS